MIDDSLCRNVINQRIGQIKRMFKWASGEELIPYIAEDSQPGLWVLVTIYRRLLERIAEKQYDVFTAKVALSRWEKLRVLGKGFLKRIT